MTSEEIKKALECCSNPGINYCKDCPYNKNGYFSCCNGIMCKDTLDLVTKQENEIEYRKKQYDNQIAENTRLHIEYDKAFEQLKAQQREIDVLKAENEKLKMYNDKLCQGIYWGNGKQFSNAIEQEKEHTVKEFAEKLKERCHNYYPSIDHYCCSQKAVNVKDIDELLQEY